MRATHPALALALLLLLTGVAHSQPPVPQGGIQPGAYLPLVIGMAAAPSTGCDPSELEAAVAVLLRDHPDQRRPSLTCDAILEQVAQERARDMAERGYFAHINPDGLGPNELVRRAGYRLPSWWGADPQENYIETIGVGYSTADAAFQGWMSSMAHRNHVLAEESFFADQVFYGIGYYHLPSSPYKHYWVVITAPPQE